MDKNAPTQVTLFLNGKEFAGEIVSVYVTHEIGGIPFLCAVLSLGADENPSCEPGMPVELKAGSGKQRESWFKGEVTSIGIGIRSGARLLRVEGRDKAHTLALGLRNALYLQKSDGEICKEILARHGVAATIPQTSSRHEQVQQALCTDWDFLLSRLQASGLAALVRDGALTAQKFTDIGKDGNVTLDAAAPVLELEAVRENRSWLQGVTVLAWNEEKQKVEESKAPDAKPSVPGKAPTGCGLVQTISVPRKMGAGEREGLGSGLLWQSHFGAVRGRVEVEGFFTVKPGQMLELKGMSPLAEGKGPVWGVRLSVEAGRCSTHIQFGYDFLESLRACHASPAGGLGGPLGGRAQVLNGLFPGKVLKIAEDPENGERIQVHIPLLHEEGKGVWARCAALYAGPGRGVVFRPEKDDEVLLGFIGADPRAPVILGALPSKAAASPDDLAARDERNLLKGIVSKKGLKILLDEDQKAVTVETPAKQLIRVCDKDGEISLRDKNNNSLLMDKNGITLKSWKDITLQAQGNIMVKATQNVKLNGLDVSLDAQKALAASGGAASELKAAGILTLKGGLVKIN